MKRKNLNFIIGSILLFCMVGCNEPDTSVSSVDVDDDIPVITHTQEQQPAVRIVLDEVPEYISNRGVILRGKNNDNTHRHDVDSDISAPWYERYLADCNLSVESSEEEIKAFVKKIDEDATFPTGYDGSTVGCVEKRKRSGSPEYIFRIHQTYKYKEDCSKGYVMYYVDDGMSCGTPVFFDPSGKYLLDTALWDIPDDILIKFLEPEMTEIKYTPDFLGAGEETTVTKSEDIEKVLDIMHSLEVRLEKEEHPELDMAEYQSMIRFTDVNGNVNEYIIIGAYLIHGENTYYVENSDKLKELETILVSP